MSRVLALLVLAGVRLLASGVATDLAREFQSMALDPDACYRVTDLNLAKEDIKIYLASGYLIFTKPIAGFRQGAVFVVSADAGDAEVLLLPPSRTERLSLATFTQYPNLEEHFSAAAFVFSDGTAEELISRMDENSTGKRLPEMGHTLADQWNPVLRNISGAFETTLVHDALTRGRKAGFFYMAVSGNKLGNFDLLYDPSIQEQIYVGKLVYRNDRAYFDSWSSFESRSMRNGGAQPEPQAVLDDFQIDSTIGAGLKMSCVTRARLTLKRAQDGPLRFSISPNMHVTAASIDGNPVEVFSRASLPSNVIAGAEDSEFLLLPSSPLDPGKPHQLEIHHEGEVIFKAGEGVYYVGSRGTWYPRLGTEFARYDLTFHYPRNLTLVATGAVVEDRTEGDSRITRRKTEAPVRFVGFNLGDFQTVSIDQDGYKIDVYANRHVEAALQPRAPVPPNTPPAAVARPRGGLNPRQLLPEVTPAPPDPAGRLAQIERGVVETVDFMSKEFGPPALHNLAITPIPATFGQGFPGLVYLSTLAYLNPNERPERLQSSYPETFYSELLEPHEIAHQWWGNLVTPASYRDEWLIESLANYCALLLLEKEKGVKALDDVLDDYRNRLLSKTENGHTLESSGPITWGRRLQSSLAPNAWQIIAYQKGTWVIHMLRRQLGDDNFYRLLREVASRYRFSPISTDQFRELASAYTPPESKDKNLRGFFDNWVDGTGIPTVKLAYSWSAGKLTGTLTQSNVGEDFTALVPVEVQTANHKMVYWLPTADDPVPFNIPLPAPPARVALAAGDCLINTAR